MRDVDELARARALLGLATRLSGLLDLDAVLQATCAEIGEVFGVAHTAVSLRDATGEWLRVAACTGIPDGVRARIAPVSRALVEAAAARGADLIVHDLPFDPAPNSALHRDLGLTATAVGVLREEGGALLGLLAVTATGGRRFSAGEGDLLRAIAPIVARAIARARTFAEQRARVRAMTALHGGDDRLAADLSFEEAAERAVRACVESLDVAVAWIGAVEPEGRIRLVARAPAHETYPDEITVRWDDTPEGRGPGGQCVRRKTAIQCTDLDGDSSFGPWAASARRHALRANVAVPLIGRDRVFGALGVYSRDVQFFDAERVSFLRAFADVVAGAMENARLARERREIDARLVLADRMASLGTLAAGVAHEINNPLAYVVANLDYALGHVHGAELASALGDALAGALRVRDIVRDLKTFSRPDAEAKTALDLSRVLESAIAMAAHEIRHRARLVREGADVPPVFGNESRLGQVFLNLLVNAAHAIPEPGAEPDAGAWTRRADEQRICVGAKVVGARVAVEVRDTGVGIPAENRARIFDPFFTTKPVGHGTGLGLAICHAIVRDHGGEIEVESEPGRGSTFRVLLPIAAHEQVSVSSSTRASTRRARILVIDDEPRVGEALARALEEHEVAWCTDVKTAIERVSRGEVPDLVVCDLMMPGAGGIEWHAWASDAEPALASRTLFATGGASTAAARSFAERHPERCVDKPFDLARLRALLAKLDAER